MIASYSGNTPPGGEHQWIARPTTKPTPQNEIYYGTQPKRITIFRHPHKNINGKIITDIYHKPTDIQQYLHFRSHHAKNCIKSIPYTLARRIHTIITEKTKQKKTCLKELHTTLHQRGYPTTLINKGLELAEKIPLRELRNPKKKQQKTPSIHHNLQQK